VASRCASYAPPSGNSTRNDVPALCGLVRRIVPPIGFLIFQRTFLCGSGLGGALKG